VALRLDWWVAVLPSSNPSESPSSQPSSAPSSIDLFEAMDSVGYCKDSSWNYYSALISSTFGLGSHESCQSECLQHITDGFRGIQGKTGWSTNCICLYDVGNLPASTPDGFTAKTDDSGVGPPAFATSSSGTGPISQTDGDDNGACYKYLPNSNN